MIADVKESVRQLGHLLAGIEGLAAGSGGEDSRLAEIRAELDQGLAVARAVAERMQALDRELAGQQSEPGSLE
jgi:hypothetical protein